KRVSADDSAGSRVKVGHRQALTAQKPPVSIDWGFLLWGNAFGICKYPNAQKQKKPDESIGLFYWRSQCD
ncbi:MULTISPECIES: hypothetical protein, partial [unclassified Variovorax]|uniref:hypothetical protein n=1 Tax=unclassified Variovorax TaxID=663243 RepID=UPI003F48F633